jgi:hypothetical protein
VDLPQHQHESDLEAELLELARSDDNGRRLQARVTAIRTALRQRTERDQESLSRVLDDVAAPSVEPENELAWFRLDLPFMVARARGFNIPPLEWNRGSRRVREIMRQVDAILEAQDPFGELDRWAASLSAR